MNQLGEPGKAPNSSPGALATDTFVLMTARVTDRGVVERPRGILEETDNLDQLPPELFACEPGMSGKLVAGNLETKPLRHPDSPKARVNRDTAIGQILKLTDQESGVAAIPNLGGELMKRSGLYIDQWTTAANVLKSEGCITTVKPAVRRIVSAMIVHPGHIERAVQTGKLSLPTDEQIEKLAKIDHASRIASLQAVAKALKL